MKRLITILMMLGFLTVSAEITPALAKHGHRGGPYYYYPQRVKYVGRPYYYSPYYYYPYYVPARPLYVRQPVVYPAWYYPPPSLFNFNFRL